MVWFGNTEKIVDMPSPLTEADASFVVSGAEIQLGNGGAVVDGSVAGHRQFSWSWIGDPDVLSIIREFRQGVHGPGPFYWVDPFAMKRNLFAPNWASPRVVDTGDWKEIYDTDHTAVVSYAPSAYGRPRKGLTYDLSLAPTIAPRRRFTILLPPGFSLWLGASGSYTGTGGVGYRTINADGTYSAITVTQPRAVTDANQWISFGTASGSSTVVAVEIFLARSSSAASTVTIASLIAQLHPTGSFPGLPTTFISGRGTTGMRFVGNLTETFYTAGGYNMPAKIGFAQRLLETESWEL